MSRGWFVFRTERLRFGLNEGSECVMRGTCTIAAAAVVFLAACVGPPGAAGGTFGPPGGLEPSQPRYINPGTLAALPGFTHAVRVGATLYVSGEVALDSTGSSWAQATCVPRPGRHSPTSRSSSRSRAR